MTRFWHRRICEAVMLVSAIVLALYFWAFFANVESIASSLQVSSNAAIFAAVSLFVAFVLYLWAPGKRTALASFVTFALLVALTAVLILDTGKTMSPFIALWMVVSVFAGIFGIYGIGPLVGLLVGYVVTASLVGSLSREMIITVALGGLLPLVVSYLIWHTQRNSRSSGDQAYQELASELSQVAGKAEIVINAIRDGVIAIDSRGVIELINPAAQRIIGWGKQDALRLNYKSVLKLLDGKGNELTDATDPIAGVLATNKQSASNSLTLVTNSGKNLFASIMVSPVGQIGSGAIIVFRDITQEKSEERQQAEFISTASHEMRTPVASIEGYLGLALNPATATVDDKAREFIGKAHESAQHLGRLFQDLLDVSRADDGRLSSNPKVIDVVEFVHDVVQGLRPEAEQKALRMLFKPRPDDTSTRDERTLNPIYYIYVDSDHLREVVSNLVENAIKYTRQGDVVIDVTGDGDTVTISIADSGIGIPAEDIAHLFQKFYRVDNTDTREIGGTGLGLYLCRRLTEAMNGHIDVQSEYKKGSTFSVSLPRLANDDATRMIEQAAQHSAPEIGPAHAIPNGAPLEAPISQEPVPMTPPTPQMPASQRINVPLTSIEQNTAAYTQPTRSIPISIPPRKP